MCLRAHQQESVGAGNDPKHFCPEIQNSILFTFPLAHDSNYALQPDHGHHRLQIIMPLVDFLLALSKHSSPMISDNFNRARRDLFQMCFIAFGGQMASHHGDNQVARLGKAKFRRMVLQTEQLK